MKAIRKLNIWAVTTLMAAFCALILACGRVEAAVTILSQPQSVVAAEGQTVIFTVRATSNRSLRYYWYRNGTMLSTKTSALTVTASASSAATYSCLVSDGDTKKRCDEFTLSTGSVEPVPPATTACNCSCPGSAKLTWDRPVTRADGTALPADQIAGYQLFAMGGPAIDAPATQIATLTAVSSHTITDLTPGTHYFRLRTMDKTGLVSALSAVIAVTVR